MARRSCALPSRRGATTSRSYGSRCRPGSGALVSLETAGRVDDDVLGGKPAGAAKVRQVDDESRRDQLASRATDQLGRRFRRSPGRDQVVDEQDAVAGMNRVGM